MPFYVRFSRHRIIDAFPIGLIVSVHRDPHLLISPQPNFGILYTTTMFLAGLYNLSGRLSRGKVAARTEMLLSHFIVIRDDYEGDDGCVNQLFTPVFKIDGNAVVDRGLYLTQPPFGLIGMTDKCTGNEQI